MPTVSWSLTALGQLATLPQSDQDRVRRRVQQLASFPELGVGSRYGRDRQRWLPLGRRVVVYTFDPTDNAVRILRILWGRP